MIKYTFKEAIDLIGNGATYRTVNYYKDIYVNDVYKVEGRYFVSDAFINKVIKNRLTVKKTISEPRTKTELLKEIDDLRLLFLESVSETNELTILIGGLNIEIDELKSGSLELLKRIEHKEKDIILLENAIKELKETISDYENSEVFDKANEGMRVEVFSQDEYNLFSERLTEWRIQRKEIEMTRVHFETIKDERDFIKLQLEYFKQSNDKILTQHQNLIDGLRERNKIEAVEKGVIPKQPREI